MPGEQSPITVGVIIATYNRARFLPDALDSLFVQSRAPDEIILVDDGSRDETAEIAARYAPAVRYFYQENQGRAAAFNFGLAQSNCSHFCFFDDDDILLADGLQTHLDTLAADDKADYTYSPNLAYDDDQAKSIWDETTRRPVKHCQVASPETLFVKTLEWGEFFFNLYPRHAHPRAVPPGNRGV